MLFELTIRDWFCKDGSFCKQVTRVDGMQELVLRDYRPVSPVKFVQSKSFLSGRTMKKYSDLVDVNTVNDWLSEHGSNVRFSVTKQKEI